MSGIVFVQVYSSNGVIERSDVMEVDRSEWELLDREGREALVKEYLLDTGHFEWSYDDRQESEE